jgi:hypothetical protein
MLLVCTYLNLGPPALFYLSMQPAVADKAMEMFDQNGDGQVNLRRLRLHFWLRFSRWFCLSTFILTRFGH